MAACLAELSKVGVTGVGIVPIVESRAAFERIDRILASCGRSAVRSVIIDFCQEHRLPLLIKGPSHRPEESYLNHLCIEMDRKLAKWIKPSSVRYCSLMSGIPDGPTGLYSPDGLHLNRAGHAHVACCLEPLVKALLLQAGRERDACPS